MKWFLIFCAVAFCVADGFEFRFDYSYDQEVDGWLKLHLIPATWKDARLRCHREGAELASPETHQLQTTMKRVLEGSKTKIYVIFTGTHATYSKGDYYSIGGRPLSRMPIEWASGEPNNADNNEDCLYMLSDGSVGDSNCSDVYPYVCYRKRTVETNLTSCGTFDKDYILDARTGNCYKFHTQPQKWANAFATCSAEGGHLAIINSDTEAKVLKELYAKHPASSMPGNFYKHIVHMGFRDWADRGLWITVHGQTLKDAGYETWASTQPDNWGGGQYCGGIFTNAQLDDLWCEGSYPFICEKTPDSLLNNEQDNFIIYLDYRKADESISET